MNAGPASDANNSQRSKRGAGAAPALCLLVALLQLGGCALGFNPQRYPEASSIPDAGIEVPIRVIRNVPFVQVRVNESAPLWFLVDTGSFACIIDDDAADALGMKRELRFGTQTTTAGTRFGRMDQVRFDSISIGGAEFRAFDGMATDLSELERLVGHPFHGVVSVPLISQGIWTIDYPWETLRIAPETAAWPNDEHTLEFMWSDTLPAIIIRVGEEEFSAEIDTGSTGGFDFSKDDAKRLVLDRSAVIHSSHLTLNGVVWEEIVRLEGTVHLGALSFERPLVSLSRDTMIGGEVLRDCVFSIDGGRQRVRIENAERGAAREGRKAP